MNHHRRCVWRWQRGEDARTTKHRTHLPTTKRRRVNTTKKAIGGSCKRLCSFNITRRPNYRFDGADNVLTVPDSENDCNIRQTIIVGPRVRARTSRSHARMQSRDKSGFSYFVGVGCVCVCVVASVRANDAPERRQRLTSPGQSGLIGRWLGMQYR